jgi:hypothetical protein
MYNNHPVSLTLEKIDRSNTGVRVQKKCVGQWSTFEQRRQGIEDIGKAIKVVDTYVAISIRTFVSWA